MLLRDGVDSEPVCREIDDLFRSGPVETNTRPKGVFQAQALGDLAQLIGMSHYLGYACVGLVLALVATTTVMSVQDRTKEHAVLQTIGFSGPRVFRLVLAECLLLTLTGGLLGVGAALLTLQLSNLSVGAEAVTIAFAPPGVWPSRAWPSRALPACWPGSPLPCTPPAAPLCRPCATADLRRALPI